MATRESDERENQQGLQTTRIPTQELLGLVFSGIQVFALRPDLCEGQCRKAIIPIDQEQLFENPGCLVQRSSESRRFRGTWKPRS